MKKLQKLLKKYIASFDLLSSSFNEFFKEMCEEQFGEFASGYWP